MTYKDLIDVFKAVVDELCPTALTFLYDNVWAMNGAPSITYPAMLVEAHPNFDFEGFQANSNKVGLQKFSGKLFFFDTYWQDEKAAKDTYQKQSELNELSLKIIAEIKTRLLDLERPIEIKYGSGFFGTNVHNAKLVEVFIPFSVSLRVGCDLADFTTCHV